MKLEGGEVGYVSTRVGIEMEGWRGRERKWRERGRKGRKRAREGMGREGDGGCYQIPRLTRELVIDGESAR